MNNNTNFAEMVLNQTFEGVKNPINAHAVNELLDRFGLNWKVEKLPLSLPNEYVTDYFGIVRTDLKQPKVFTTCKAEYTPFQNSELAELLIRISEKSGYTIHKGGYFGMGGKVYMQLNSPNQIQGLGENRDRVEGFLTGINSHDGTSSLRWGSANITISCMNTFLAASKQLENKMKHTTNLRDKVEYYIRQLDAVVEQEKCLFDEFIKLSSSPITREIGAKIVEKVSGVDVLLPNAERLEKFSPQANKKSVELLASIKQETEQKGQTLWGLFSGVTHYTTHKLGNKQGNERLESTYVGQAFNINNDVYKIIKEYGKIGKVVA
jgi:phage/plasmid-like protein (TIGR03299 family)